ncbi:MAG: cell division protein FtsQ/DivIB [Gallionellaceae bacterium]|nr:cell division protein FtsQ/DivIB [Gallionellaceae bacterium]MDD5365763.1 cell division protein FtsQ/DivIB [Gallionellaceae bacterium]
MWNDPASLNRLSGLLLSATVLFALWMAGSQVVETWLPIRSVEVRGALHKQTRQAIGPVLADLSGGLFSVDLEAARQGFEALPWVRVAQIRRVWPGSLVVELEEHVPAAAWNDLAVLDVYGEVFPVSPWRQLPSFHAPEGMEREVASRYGEFVRLLGGRGWRVAGIRVDARRAWRIDLADGVTIDLGRDRLDERLQRFVTFYPLVLAKVTGIRRVDMRYPNGFAVQGEART